MNRLPLIIDCDTGIDDILALVVALSSPKLDVLGITTVAGNQKLEMTTYNTLNALELMGRKEIRLAKGMAQPLERPLHDAGYIHGKSGLGEYVFPYETDLQPVEQKAPEFIFDLLMNSSEPVTILALAPLTNLAKLVTDYPKCKDKISKIVFMGGSIRSGNPTPVSTFNVLADPEAAKIVLKAGIPFYMCPLDTTRESYFTPEDLAKIKNYPNLVAQMAEKVTQFYVDSVNKYDNGSERFEGICIHDLCTAVFVTNPELFTWKKYYCDVETKGELTTGFTMIDYENILKKPMNERNVYYIDSVNREKFLEVFFTALESFNNKAT